VNDRVRVYHLTELKDRRRDLRKKSTLAEKLLWEKLRNNNLGMKFRRQYSVRGYVLDFYCSKARLGMEVEGGIHKSKSVKVYDKYREEYLKAFNIKIIKFKNREVLEQTDKLLERIRGEFTRLIF
jgi:very-short-patch-repair endonuclease